MEIIKIGEPLTTKTGTIVQRFIENGRFYKSIDFSNSVNKIAQQRGLIKTIVEYGEGNKPERIFDTFERKIIRPAENPAEVQAIEKAKEKTLDKNISEREINLLDDKTVLDSYKITNKQTLHYKDYYSYVDEIKTRLDKYKDVLPPDLYADIMKRYGIEEKSIRKILQDNYTKPEDIKGFYGIESFKSFINRVENKEKEYTDIDLSDMNMRKAFIYTSAWTHSLLRVDLNNACIHKWRILKAVWQKSLYSDTSIYSTPKLIDTYLLQEYRQNIRDYKGMNPLQKFEDDPKLTKKKIAILQYMYSGSKNLDNECIILKDPAFRRFKETVDIDAMTKTIESIETHYKNAFFKQFWTEQRRERFSNALKDEYAKFNKQAELPDNMYETVVNEVMAEEALSK